MSNADTAEKCPHDRYGYEDCEPCAEEAGAAALAAKDAEIAELRARVENATAAWDHSAKAMGEEAGALRSEIARLTAERDEAKRIAVDAVDNAKEHQQIGVDERRKASEWKQRATAAEKERDAATSRAEESRVEMDKQCVEKKQERQDRLTAQRDLRAAESALSAAREALAREWVRWSAERSFCVQCRTTTAQEVDPRVPHDHAPSCLLAALTPATGDGAKTDDAHARHETAQAVRSFVAAPASERREEPKPACAKCGAWHLPCSCGGTQPTPPPGILVPRATLERCRVAVDSRWGGLAREHLLRELDAILGPEQQS